MLTYGICNKPKHANKHLVQKNHRIGGKYVEAWKIGLAQQLKHNKLVVLAKGPDRTETTYLAFFSKHDVYNLNNKNE